MPAARPAEVSGQTRRIDKIYYLPKTHVPLELESALPKGSLARSKPDLDGDMETVRERVFM